MSVKPSPIKAKAFCLLEYSPLKLPVLANIKLLVKRFVEAFVKVF
jgi:hypothetical protein